MPSFRLSLKFLICFALRKNQAWAWWDRLSALLQWYWQRTFDEPLVFRTEDAGRLRAEHQAGLLNYEGCQTSERKAELGPSHPGEPQDEVSEAQRHEVSSQTHPASEDHTKNWNLGLWFEVQHSFHDEKIEATERLLPHAVPWVNGETKAGPDTTGRRSWKRLYYEYEKRSIGNSKDILAVALRELFYFSKLILSYLNSRIIMSYWKLQCKDQVNSYK
ncbi:uncharacterized protein LOC118019677 isoform X3 [Mirounga leonina]|uniref:uncharacterized protein LOC118019677 isoform X3 n=1 Tax=Mirounga leonina TaxID=9715 RepID=UPI00156C2E8D|nr:uncharacterized protein LOC118019677 isoform X3 [Mirounga leonina]